MSIIDEALSANATIATDYDAGRGKPPEQVQKARSHPWISAEVPIRGFIYDVNSGRLSEVFPKAATVAGR